MIPKTDTLQQLDHAHLWHPFTPMKQWRESPPLVIERGDGPYVFDTDGKRYIDGTSSLWCNVHGHRHPAIDQAVSDQLDNIAHSTLLGLSNPPAIEFAAKLVERINRNTTSNRLNKVFLSDAGATAVEAAFKMAVGYWYHHAKPDKNRFIGLQGAYHGDTVGSMSVGYSPLFHKPFVSMVFDIDTFPAPDALRPDETAPHLHTFRICQHPERTCPTCSNTNTPCHQVWPNECSAYGEVLTQRCVEHLDYHLQQHADTTAAIVIEPVMQGAAGMVCQPPGFLNAVGKLARKHDVLLICDEVAVGFGRTGTMFAFESELDEHFAGPDILCLAKGISAGYLPLAATVTTDEIELAFTGELAEKKTLFHGHTYTGNPLACAAGLASLKLFDQPTHGSPDLLTHINASAELIREKLNALRGHPHILDIRQRGLMTGIELGTRQPDGSAAPFDFSKRTGYAICDKLRDDGLIVRPLGDVLVLMPIPAMPHDILATMLDQVVQALLNWSWD